MTIKNENITRFIIQTTIKMFAKVLNEPPNHIKNFLQQFEKNINKDNQN